MFSPRAAVRVGDYVLGEEIGRGATGVVYRAQSTDRPDEQVALKIADAALTSGVGLEAQVRFDWEASLLSRLSHPNIVSLRGHGMAGGTLYLAMELFQGVSLARLLAERGRMTPAQAGEIVRQVALGLAHAHGQGVLHRDIKPANVMVRVEGDAVKVKVLDFGLGRLRSEVMSEEVAGTFLYMPPEQLGILQRPVDHRSDLYALGLLAYELIAGRHPFAHFSDSLSDLLHAHAASQPNQPDGVPDGLWRIIETLLRKDPADRYRSALGVASDLAIFLERTSQGQTAVFELQTRDFAADLSASRFAGREAELARLRDALQVARRTDVMQVVSIAGSSGIGKSRLVEELERDVAASGLFLSGKGRAYGQAAAYGVFAEALRRLASRQVEGALLQRLRHAVGILGGELTRLVPEMATLLDKVPDVGELEADRRQQRFFALMVKVVASLGTPSAPLVLFLDDLQWADEGSLQLLSHLGKHRTGAPLVLILAHRLEEVGEDHPLAEVLRGLEQGGGLRRLELRPLDESAVEWLVQSILGQSVPEVTSFVAARSGGSPLIAVELVRALSESGAIARRDTGWVVDRARLSDATLSEGLLAPILDRIRRVPEPQRRLLTIAAAVGKEFEFDVVLGAIQQEPANARSSTRGVLPARQLVEALEVGREAQLITPMRQAGHYSFAHDQLRESLYEALADAERTALHGQIGAALEMRHGDAADAAYGLAYHFGRSSDLTRAMHYGIRAGSIANERHAHIEALRFYEQALCAWGELPAQAHVEEHSAILEGVGDACAMTGRYQRALESYSAALENELRGLDAARVSGKVGDIYFRQGEMNLAAQSIRGALEALGERLPQSRLGFALMLLREAVVQVWHTLRPIRRAATDHPIDREILRLYYRASFTYYFLNTLAALAVHIRHVNLSERTQNQDAMGWAYAAHGPACATLPLFNRAIGYARRSLALRQKLGDRWGAAHSRNYLGLSLSNSGRWQEAIEQQEIAKEELERLGDRWELVALTTNLSVNHWFLGTWDKGIGYAREAIAIASEVGDIRGRGNSTWMLAEFAGAVGTEECLHEVDEVLPTCLAQGCILESVNLLRVKGALNLRIGAVDEAVTCLQQSLQLAGQHMQRSEYLMSAYPAMVDAYLASAAMASSMPVRRRALRKAVRGLRVALFHTRLFSTHLPYTLRVKGRYQWLCGKRRKAEQTIHAAFRLALDQGNRYEQALAMLDLGRLWAGVGDPRSVGALENCLPILDRLGAKEDIAVARELLRQPGEVVRGSSRPTTEGRGVLDGVRLASLLEVGQRLSATLDPDALLQQILASAVKVLGAERGILYLAEGVDNQLVARSTHGAADAPATLSVAQEVWRTGVGSLLADAQIDPRFAGAASVVSSGVRSILCVPLSFKSRTLGVLYLDSRLVSGIFTRADLDLLQALASYAAVALENTRAFHALEQSRSDLEIMHEASRRLGAELEQAKVLQTLLEEAIRLAQARGGGIVTSEGEQPRLRLQRGLETPKIQAIVRALPTWRLSRAESTVEDLCGDDRALVQPLWAGGRHVGALFVVGAASAERAGRLIAPLCTQASMALRNAELYELAVTDGLTRLFQRRYFDQALDRLVRARAEPVSVVIADLDDFKPVNDRYGHAAGDEVLRRVAQVLREHVRITDIPSRLGGDEFGVILPDTGKEEGLRVLRKLREAFHGATVSVAGTTLSVGASFGLACSDETADTTELLALADKRLYEAKQAAKMAG